MEKQSKTVFWKDGTFLIVPDGVTWEYEDDEDWERTEATPPTRQGGL